MKNKKGKKEMKRSSIILACILAFLLCACTAAHDKEHNDSLIESSEVKVNNTTAESEIGICSNAFPGYVCEAIAGLKSEDFIKAFAQAETNVTSVEPVICNTPEKVYFRYSDRKNYRSYILAWDKKSGDITYACPDQSCEHNDCIFASSYLDFMMYYNGGLLICGRTEDGRQTLHTTDENGDNEKLIFETKHTLSILGISIHGSEIYLLLPEKTNLGETVYRINEIRDGIADPISPKDVDIAQFTVISNGIYAVYAENSKLVFTADRFGTVTECADKAVRFYATDDHLLYNTLDNKTYCDGEYLIPYIGDMQLVGDYLYYISEQDHNELLRVRLTGGKQEHVLYFKTDGINDDYNDYLIDPLGFVYTIASTYEDNLISGGSLNTEDHFMIYDIENEDGEKKVFVLE